jgi:hypothetical protein
MWEKDIVTNLRHYRRIFLQELRTNMENLKQDIGVSAEIRTTHLLNKSQKL